MPLETIHKECSTAECGSQFMCYGECNNLDRVTSKEGCFCPECARRKASRGHGTPRCESRFREKAKIKIDMDVGKILYQYIEGT